MHDVRTRTALDVNTPRDIHPILRNATRVCRYPDESACTPCCCQRQTQWDRPSPATKTEGRKEEQEAEALGTSWLLDALGLALGSLRCIAFPLQLSTCASVPRRCIHYPGAARYYYIYRTGSHFCWLCGRTKQRQKRFRFHFKGSCEAFSAGESILDQICELNQICDMGRSSHIWQR